MLTVSPALRLRRSEPASAAQGNERRSEESGSSAPRVSIIMPVYNGERYVDQAIGSVLGANPNDLVFTSSGTESVNLAIRGAGPSTGPAGRM